MKLARYSMGIGDRFGLQGEAQLQAIQRAAAEGVSITPIWNKSHREHRIIGTRPEDVRGEADAAVKALAWPGAYHVDADHINLTNVDLFVQASDFFTLDVADCIDQPADEAAVQEFVKRHRRYVGTLAMPGTPARLEITAADLDRTARRYLRATQEAGRIYRHVAAAKGVGNFITEVSMDETASPQTPVGLFLILAALAEENVPAETIAPKFTGRFNKGVDYSGDLVRFAREFEEDLAVVAVAVREFHLPDNLKLSVHSGSDKFSLYPLMNRLLRRADCGVHLKTAGTTWLEELIGLAEAGGEGLTLAQEIYRQAWGRMEELTAPYATTTDIDSARLPSPAAVSRWPSAAFVEALRHDPACPEFNRHFRQLLHVGYKIGAEMGDAYRQTVVRHRAIIADNVTRNLYERHIRPLFM